MTVSRAVTINLSGRVAIVTGASRRQGIGAAILFTHWQPFDRDHGNGEDGAGPEALVAELRSMGVRTAALAVDLATPDA